MEWRLTMSSLTYCPRVRATPWFVRHVSEVSVGGETGTTVYPWVEVRGGGAGRQMAQTWLLWRVNRLAYLVPSPFFSPENLPTVLFYHRHWVSELISRLADSKANVKTFFFFGLVLFREMVVSKGISFDEGVDFRNFSVTAALFLRHWRGEPALRAQVKR